MSQHGRMLCSRNVKPDVVTWTAMSRHGAYISYLTSCLFQSYSFCLSFGIFFKTTTKRGIIVELNAYSVNLASRDQYIREIYA